MGRKKAFILGNIFMGLGMAGMLISLAYVLLSHIFSIKESEFFAGVALVGLFVGALVWLGGASLGGREHITDRYWWLKNHDERYRRKKQHKHS